MNALLALLALLGSALAEPDAAPAPPDRSRPPPVAPAEPLDLPEPEVLALRPGVTVHHVQVPGLRKSRIDLYFRQGGLGVDGRMTAAYTAMAWLQDQRTRAYPAERVASIEALGDLDVWTDGDLLVTTAQLEAPPEGLDEGLALLRDVVVAPRWSRQDLRLLARNSLRRVLSEGPTLAADLIDAGLTYGWFPKDHPLAPRPDVKGWHGVRVRHLAPRHAAVLGSPVDVVVVSSEPLDALRPRLEALLEGVGAEGPLPEPPTFDRPEGRRVLAVDLAGTPQVAIGVRHAAPRFDDPDSPAFVLLDHAVGRTFLSRLNGVLREEKGLTYGIGSSLTTAMGHGHWSITTEVAADRTGEALDAIFAVIDGVVADGLTADEVADGATDAARRWNRTLATVGSAAGVYGARVRHGRDGAALRARLDATRSVAPADTRAVAERWIGPDSPRLLILVGDRRRIEPALEARGLEASWIPAELLILGGP